MLVQFVLNNSIYQMIYIENLVERDISAKIRIVAHGSHKLQNMVEGDISEPLFGFGIGCASARSCCA